MNNCKKIIITSVCLLFTVLFCVVLYFTYLTNFSVNSSNVDSDKIKTVIVDAGHGGEDGGAVAADGTVEKEINLSIAKDLKNILILYGYNVIMTRESDMSIHDEFAENIRQKKVSDIRNRFKIIESKPDALFVSIHENIFHDSSQHGTQTFYSKNNNLSCILAQCIQQSFADNIQPENNRTVKPTGTEIYLLYNAKSVAVMVECGFLSNSDELNKLKNENYRKQIALTIADGIIKYGQVNKNGIKS